MTIDTVNRGTEPADHPGTTKPSPSERGSDYAVLSREVKQSGLLRRRPGYYSVKVGANLLLLAAGWTAFALIGQSWWQLVTAAFLAVMFTQTGFIGHDAGHHQIARSKRVNNLLGRVHADLLIGLSYGWWISKHNRHHSHPNHVDRDPDIADGAIAFTEEQARVRSGAYAWLARHQAWLFFPMLLLEGLALHVAGVRALLERTGTTTSRSTKLAEAGLLTAHLVGYLAALFLVLSPSRPWSSSPCTKDCSGCTWGAPSLPTTRACPSSPRTTGSTSCVAKSSPRATSAATGSPTSRSAD